MQLNVNQATKEYLERYVEKKTENAKKLTVTEAATEKEGEAANNADITESTAENNDLPKTVEDDFKKDDSESVKKESHNNVNFRAVTDSDKEADMEASQKLMCMIEERLKNKPLPQPASPAPPADVLGNESEILAKSRDKESGADLDG